MPHRALTLTTRYTAGPDVGALQRAVNDRRKARNLSTIEVDGQWGPETDYAVRETAWVLGLASQRITGPVSVYVQDLIEHPEKRNKTQLNRAKKRIEQLSHSAHAVVQAALKHVGEHENPAGSNRGPGIISRCQKAMLGYDGWAWCGAFTGIFLERVGGVHISRRRIVYTPSIVGDARARINGFSDWHPVSAAREGDLALFDWTSGDGVIANHVELVVRNLGAGKLECVGGNTANGQNNNAGGAVCRQTRQAGLIGVARPRYASA